MSATPAPQSSPRYLFIDRLRGWAVIIMIETHVVNALLAPAFREQSFYNILTFFNGLVAPSFLFCAGFAFAIASNRKWQDYIRFGPAARRYAQRLLFILLVAYSLHLPFFSLQKMIDLEDRELWISFFQVDILQTISVSLLLLLGATLVLRTPRAHQAGILILSLGMLIASPLINQHRYDGLPIPLGGYVSHGYASQFPLFPWSVFLFAGYLVASVYNAVPAERRKRAVTLLSWSAVLLIAVSLVVETLPVSLYGVPFWSDTPQFVLLRLGIVILLMSMLHAFESPATAAAPAESRSRFSFPGMPLLFGRESLLVYVYHLTLVYGKDVPWSLISIFGETLSYPACFGLFLLVAAVMYLMAWAWHWLKGFNPRWAKAILYMTVVGTAAQFIFL